MGSKVAEAKKVASQQGTRAIDSILKMSMGERRCLVVPEWGDLEMWFGLITEADMESTEAREPKSHLERKLYLLISMAQDKGGKPLFTYGDLIPLRTKASFTVLEHVFDFMFSPMVTREEAEKKIESDPTSEAS